MDKPLLRLAEASGLKTSGSHEWPANVDEDISEFVSSIESRALFVVEQQEGLIIGPPPRSGAIDERVLVIVKSTGTLPPDSWDSHVLVAMVPLTGNKTFNFLHSLLSRAVLPIFDSQQSNAGQQARHKLVEAERALAQLLRHTEVAFIDLNAGTAAAEAREVLEALKSRGDLGSDDVSSVNLNKLQAVVNLWKQQITELTLSDRNVREGSASDEIGFWVALEAALRGVQDQLASPLVAEVWAVLEKNKRFHATHNFSGDTGLSDALTRVQGYTQLLFKDLPLGELLAAAHIDQLTATTDAIFTHISKKLRASAYPTQRSVAFVEAIGRDFSTAMLKIADSELESVLDAEFEDDDAAVDVKTVVHKVRSLVSKLVDAAEVWDSLVRDFATVVRDLMRRRTERFFVVRIESTHSGLVQRAKALDALCVKHAELRPLLTGSTVDVQPLDRAFSNLLHAKNLFHVDEDLWHDLEVQYSREIHTVEKHIAEDLLTELNHAQGDEAQLFAVLARHQSVLNRPEVRIVVHRFQTSLIDTAGRDFRATELRARALPGWDADIVERVKIKQQLRLRTEEIKTRLAIILGPEWRQHADGAEIGGNCDDLQEKLVPDRDVAEWSTALLTTASSISKKTPSPQEQCVFTIDKAHKLVVQGRVQYSQNSLRSLKALGFRFEPAVSIAADQIAEYEAGIARLSDALAVLDALSHTLQLYPRISASEDVVHHSHHVIAFVRLGLTEQTWNSPDLAEFVTGLEKAVSLLDNRVTVLARTDALVAEELSKPIADIKEMRQRVTDLVESAATSGRYVLVAMSDLNRVVSAHIASELSKWTPSRQVHRIELVNQSVQLVPDLPSCLTRWFAEINELLGPTIEHTPEMTTAYAKAASKIWQAWEVAQEQAQHWLNMQPLWDLNVEDAMKEHGRDIEVLSQSLEELVAARNFPTRKEVESAAVVFDSSEVRVILESKCGIWQNALAHKLADAVYAESSDLMTRSRGVRQQLEKTELDFSGLLAGIKIVSEGQEIVETLKTRIPGLSTSQALLGKCRFTLPVGWISAESVQSELQALEAATERRIQDLQTAKPRLLKELESRTAQLVGNVEQFRAHWLARKPLQAHIEPENALKTLRDMNSQAGELQNQTNAISDAFRSLDPEKPLPLKLKELMSETASWAEDIEKLSLSWTDIAAAWSVLKKLGRELLFTTDIYRLSQETKDLAAQISEVPNRVKQLSAFSKLSEHAQLCVDNLPKLVLLRQSDAIKPRHILQIIPHVKVSSEDSIELHEVWTRLPDTARISEVVEAAEGEYQLSRYLETVASKWQETALTGQNGAIRNLDVVLQLCSDHLAAFKGMRASPYFPAVAASVLDWERRLGVAQQCFDYFVDLQQQYIYLRGVFSSDAVSTVLPNESRRFKGLADEFERIYSKSEARPALEVAGIPRLASFMSRLISQFSLLYKSLSGFLETQRQRFPKLYFVGDDDLLEIVGSNISSWGFKHLNSIFPGILRIESDYAISPEGERLLIGSTEEIFALSDSVEMLIELNAKISSALAQTMRSAISSLAESWDNPIGFGKWLESVPVQAALVALRAQWSQHIKNSSEARTHLAEYDSLLQWLSAAGDDSLLWVRKRETVIAELTHERDNLSPEFPEMHITIETSSSGSLTIKCGAESWSYGPEYVGVPEPIVRTRVTDNLYFSAISTIAQKQGGSIIGPAGTGKTETIKSLGAIFGRRVIVFNCDDQFDFVTVSRAMEGCAATGSWACFDEFNRLSRDVLSSVAQIVSDGASRAPVFVTMNPGYAGRTTLPPNMRSQFREFVLDNPDSREIARVLLGAHGRVAPETADATVELLSAMKGRASVQEHYDWGLRALKGVLRVCQMVHGQMRTACEIAIRPRLVSEDQRLFDEEIEKAFPGSHASGHQNEHTQLGITTDLIEDAALGVSEQLVPYVQTLSTFCQLFTGVMLLGSSGSGKTTIRETLVKWAKAEAVVIDPSATPKSTLLGRLDPITREWTDGLLSRLLRRITNNLRGEQSKHWFVIFDGEIEPDWAEALNSVLDNTRQLTLPNGEILAIPPKFHIIFETTNLTTATPATVSRCGMICVPEFRSEYPGDDDGEALRRAITASQEIGHSMEFMESRIIQTYDSLDLGNKWLSMIWAVAGDSDRLGREHVSDLIRSIAPAEALLPKEGSLTDYYVSELTGRWHSWYDSVGIANIESDAVIKPEMVIPTADTASHEALLQAALTSRRPLLLVGPPGSGKTMTLFSALRQLPQVDLIALNFSSNTSPELVIQALEMHCEYTQNSDGSLVLAPSGSRWAALFIDEINLPRPNRGNGSHVVQVIQFLRHLIEYNGFYDKSGQFVKVERVQLIAACNPPPQRRPLPSSLLRHLTIIQVGYPSPKSLATIYSSFMRTFNAETLVQPMLSVYEKLSEVLPMQTWSPRELTRWMRGIYTDWTATAEGSRTPDLLVKIWLYEGCRVLSDRLEIGDQTKIQQLLYTHIPRSSSGMATSIDESFLQHSVWTHFMTQRPRFVPLSDLRAFMAARLGVFIEEAANEGDLHLVAHDDFIHHVTRTDRILRQPQGHAMLVGPPSVGKTTTVRFACWLNGVDLRIIRSHSTYSDSDFAQDLRKILIDSTRRPICLLMSEDLMRVPEFVEKMNSLLANGEVPGLFGTSEQLAELEENCRRAGYDGGDLIPWLRMKIVQNLHVVFKTTGMSSVSPALLNRCAVNRVEPWSYPVKQQVAESWCSSTDAGMGVVQVLAALEPLPWKLQSMKGSVSFIESCYQFVRIYNRRKTETEESQLHFVTGSDRLKSTVLEIGSLKRKLAEQQKQLSEESQRSSDVLAQMLSEQSEAERKRVAAVEIRAAVQAQTQQIEKRQKIAHDDLAATEPLIEQAAQGVRNIKKSQLNELRSMMNPPEPVKITLEAVCLVLGLKTDGSWRQVLAAVRGDEFIPRIVNFDSYRLTPELLSKIEREYMSIPSFTYERVDRASKAGGPLLRWVVAQISYGRAIAAVQPLMVEIENLNHQASESRAQLSAIESMLVDLESSIEKSKREYSHTVAQCEILKADMHKIDSQLVRAETLLSSLDGEKDRWLTAAKEFPHNMALLAGRSLMEAAMISLAGQQEKSEKEMLISHVQELAVQNSINLEPGILPEIDDIDFANREIIETSRSVVLVIDPGNRWNVMEEGKKAKSNLKITSFLLDPDTLAKELDVALRFGQHLVIQHAERFDPLVLPLLNRDFVRKGSRLLVNFGKGDIDVSPGFRLTLHSRGLDQESDSQRLLVSRVNIADFTITGDSFEQMIGDLLLAARKPELASKRTELQQVDIETSRRLRELEQSLLRALAESSATEKLLDNHELLHSLEKLKAETNQLNLLKQSTKQTLEELNVALKEFLPQAKDAAQMYEVSRHLSELDKFYNVGMDWLWVIAQQCSQKDDFVAAFKSEILARLLRITRCEHWDAIVKQMPGTTLPEPIPLLDVISECPSTTPIIAGMATPNTVDPASSIIAGSSRPVAVIAMGSARAASKAETMILQAMELGEWVVVQNIEIAKDEWLRNLSRRMQTSTPSTHFRLILTGLQSEIVTIPEITTAGRPISVERPHGVRSELLNSLISESTTFLDFLIGYVHACFAERFQGASFSVNDLASARWFAQKLQGSRDQQTDVPNNLLRQSLLTAIWTAKTGIAEDKRLMDEFVKTTFGATHLFPKTDFVRWTEQLPADEHWLPRELAQNVAPMNAI